MGWTFPYHTFKRSALIAERTAPSDYTRPDGVLVESRALKHCYRGNRHSGVLYIVWEQTFYEPDGITTDRFIEVDLLRYYETWGYKDMDESCGPRYWSCPLSYLDMVPERCPEWRMGVREHAAKVAAKTKATKARRKAARGG
jgi:hypothetical protein